MEGRPSFQFYPGDWMRDPMLRLCSLSAQGLWMRMLCVMHDGNPRGYLRVGPNSIVVPKGQLPVLLSTPPDATAEALEELLAAGVASVAEDGALFSRRMVKDTDRLRRMSEGGRKGWQAQQLTDTPRGTPKPTPKGTPGPTLKGTLKGTPGVTPIEDEDEDEVCNGSGKGGVRGGGKYTTEFEEFWRAYPMHRTRKQGAFKAWKATTRARPPLTEVLEKLEALKKTKRWLDGYVVHPKAWLEEHGWEDEVEEARPAPKTEAQKLAQVGAGGGDYPWHPDDLKEYKDHPAWDAYYEGCDADQTIGRTWPRFEEWLKTSDYMDDPGDFPPVKEG